MTDLEEKLCDRRSLSDVESEPERWEKSNYSSDESERPAKRRRLNDSFSEHSVQGDSDYFKSLNKPKVEEKLGKAVNPDLAEAVDRFFRRPITDTEFKEYKIKYLRPENVKWIQTPEIPMNIWTRLPQDFKNADKPIHFVQEQMGPVLSSLIYSMEKLGEGDLVGGRDILSDTMAMLGFVFRTNMTEKRRVALKTKLPDDFKILASDKCEPSPSNLLGDLSENTKKVTETEKITSQMDRKAKEKSTNFKKPYKDSHSSWNSRKDNKGFKKSYNSDKKSDSRKDDRKDNYKKSFRRGGHNNRK